MTSTQQKNRVFSLQQANAMLPLVRSITSDLSRLARDVNERRSRLAALGYDPEQDHEPGDLYSEELLHIGNKLEEDARLIRGYAHELRELGVEPRNQAEGFVDFPAELDGNPVRLCWKLGETAVTHWHGEGEECSDRRLLPGGEKPLSAILPSQQ